MELQTISQVSKAFYVSTRTLRYYEQIGLLSSVKKEEYAYRTYDEAAVLRLQQIIILRKLRLPLRQIAEILKNEDEVLAMEVFQTNVSEIEDEITALSTIKSILNTFVGTLNESVSKRIKLDLFGDESILKIVDALTVTKINFKEEKSMEDLNKSNEKLQKIKDVRIIHLPAATVAAYQYLGDDPEMHANMVVDEFVRSSGLTKMKPDLRNYGFNSPNPIDNSGYHGYEIWVTIPDDMDVPAPLTKKNFEGGLYAAHMIPMGAFDEWGLLYEWVTNDNPKYEGNSRNKGAECMWGCLEEHLNYISHIGLPNSEPDDMQLDLLSPIKVKEN